VGKMSYAIGGLILASQARGAEPVIFQDWGTGMGKDNTFMFAATVNDSGETFGEFCYFKTKSCSWYVLLHTACKPGTVTPVLANSDASALPLVVTCNGQMPGGELYSDAFGNWKDLETVLTDSIHIGFAIPLAEDRFTVARFSLNGRTKSTQVMEAAFAAQVSRPPEGRQGTADQTL
jgi:hypothetical protein